MANDAKRTEQASEWVRPKPVNGHTCRSTASKSAQSSLIVPVCHGSSRQIQTDPICRAATANTSTEANRNRRGHMWPPDH